MGSEVSGTTEIDFDLSDYNEVMLFVKTNDIVTTQIIPTSQLSSSNYAVQMGAHYTSAYGYGTLVDVSSTSAKIRQTYDNGSVVTSNSILKVFAR